MKDPESRSHDSCRFGAWNTSKNKSRKNSYGNIDGPKNHEVLHCSCSCYQKIIKSCTVENSYKLSQRGGSTY